MNILKILHVYLCSCLRHCSNDQSRHVLLLGSLILTYYYSLSDLHTNKLYLAWPKIAGAFPFIFIRCSEGSGNLFDLRHIKTYTCRYFSEPWRGRRTQEFAHWKYHMLGKFRCRIIKRPKACQRTSTASPPRSSWRWTLLVSSHTRSTATIYSRLFITEFFQQYFSSCIRWDNFW
jgi:hypothetical protein